MKNNKGFALVETLLIIMIIGALAGVGWYVYQSQQQNNQGEEKTFGTNGQAEELKDETIDQLRVIELRTEAVVFKEDLANLPEEVPASFIEYFATTLPSKSDSNPNECQTGFTISKVSPVNILGNGFDVEVDSNGVRVEDSVDCGGGYFQLWGMNSEGKWVKSAGGHAAPPCSELNNPRIYSEFRSECYLEAEDSIVPNPNGSIFEADITQL